MSTHTPHVVILGGGFGGLQTAFALRRRLGQRVQITLVSEREYFLYRPHLIYVPFGLNPQRLTFDIANSTREREISFINARVLGFNPETQVVRTKETAIGYDYLVIATGATMQRDSVPGQSEHALIPWMIGDMLRLHEQLTSLGDRAQAGHYGQIVFMLPTGNGWPVPLYELAFMTDTWLRREGVREHVNLVVATAEWRYMEHISSDLNSYISREFVLRDIDHRHGCAFHHVEEHQIHMNDHTVIPFDTLVSSPAYAAAMSYDDLPTDAQGFIAVEPRTCRVQGQERVFAAGDTSSIPIKQALIAMRQADTIVDQIAADITGREPSVFFEPVSRVLIDQLDTATFAEVPLCVQDGAVVTDQMTLPQLGTSPLWRLGKNRLGAHILSRFRRALPIDAGIVWSGMEMSRKLLQTLL